MWHLQKIPKVLHLYWGNKTISFLRYLTVYSFKKMNPDWEVRVYVPIVRNTKITWKTGEHNVPFSGEDYIDRLKSLDIKIEKIGLERIGFRNDVPEVFKSDFVRLHLLSTVGGVWSDFDVVYIKSIDKIDYNIAERSDTDFSVCFHNYYSIGFMLSCKNSQFYKSLKDQVQECFDCNNYQSIGSHMMKKCYSSFGDIRYMDFGKFVNLPMHTVYPLNSRQITKIFYGDASKYINDSTIGIHWYAGSSISKNFENSITENNFSAYKNVLANSIKKIWDG